MDEDKGPNLNNSGILQLWPKCGSKELHCPILKNDVGTCSTQFTSLWDFWKGKTIGVFNPWTCLANSRGMCDAFFQFYPKVEDLL